MSDNLFTNDEARARIVAGADKVANAVSGTLGSAGYNGLIEAFESPGHIVTNDGISIANAIHLEDPVENIGANLMKEIGKRSDKQSGDGTTTSITLAQAIIHGGMKEKGVSPMQLKKSLEDCLPIIEASIQDQTKDITVDEVGIVASVSAEDADIGALIQEIYQKIGKDGILYPDVSKTFNDHYTIGSGVKIEGAGFASPYMADTDEKGSWLNVANYKNPAVLITKQKITSAGDLNDLLSAVYGKGVRELVVFCDEYEAPVVPDLVMTRAQRGFKTLLIKLPVLWKDHWFEDLAKMTGATVIGDGLTLKQAKIEHLGTVGSILVDKNDTYLDGIKDISSWIAYILESDGDDDKIRAARLNTKTARLYVGAPTDAALSYKRLKVEDARNAAWQALHGGVVAGGGVCLYNAADLMPDTPGGRILRVALKYPLKRICINAGHADMVFGLDFGGTRGYDAKNNEMVDMLEAGIVDAANTTRSAIRNAISVAATVLTAQVVVTLNKNQQPGL